MVRVLSLPACTQCLFTKKKFDALGVQYEEVDMSQHPEAAQEARALGYQAAPVVITENDHWSGFRPDKIDELAARLA